MDKKVEHAVNAAIKCFRRVLGDTGIDFNTEIRNAFNADQPFLDKVALLDGVFDDHPETEALREVFFDLLLVNFFTEDVKKLEEDYLDSPEWEAIEEDTLDRGTELLNLLLYLRECEDEDIEPELEDYLNEFLLVNDDEFQDEHRIYQDIIANQILVESSYEEIARVAGKLDESSEIGDLFYPMMSFFHEPNPSEQQIENYSQHSRDKEFDLPVYAVLTAFNQ
jgi:hypothetical protein